jgi:hypothetical protein
VHEFFVAAAGGRGRLDDGMHALVTVDSDPAGHAARRAAVLRDGA